MRIASYNLFEGAQHTYPLLQTFVSQQHIDVLCLQEVNGWQNGSPSRLEEFAALSGLKHFVFGDSNTRFKLATFSRLPFNSSGVYNDGFWHCAVRTAINHAGTEINIWNIHLNPGSGASRLAEARIIAAKLKHGIMLGDFNDLSRADQYPAELSDTLAAAGITKFGHNGLDYAVTDYLKDEGLIDTAAVVGQPQWTVPTPANSDMFHAAQLRLDYAFATADIAPLVTSFDVPKDDLTDQISDHYPIIITIQD